VYRYRSHMMKYAHGQAVIEQNKKHAKDQHVIKEISR
jgi:hypothetical protein